MYLEEVAFTLLNCLGSFVEHQLTTYMRVYYLIFYPVSLLNISCLSKPCRINYSSFIMSIKILNWVFLVIFKAVLVILERWFANVIPLHFHITYRMYFFLFVREKSLLYILIEIVLNLYINLERICYRINRFIYLSHSNRPITLRVGFTAKKKSNDHRAMSEDMRKDPQISFLRISGLEFLKGSWRARD